MKRKFRFQWGAFLMLLGYGGLFFLLFGRLLFIQITGEAEGEMLASLAESKYAREAILPAERGKIVDRNDELIATDTLSYRLVAVLDEEMSTNPAKPRHVIDPVKTATVLANYLPLEIADLTERLTRDKQSIKENKKKQVEFGKAGRDLNHETYLAIEKENLPGIIFLEDNKRFYPNGIFASYLIGFAVREEDENKNVSTVGKMGLESTFNKELTGEDGQVKSQSDKWGFTLPKVEKAIVAPKDGFDIKLTIDKTIQNFVEDAMTQVEKEYSPQRMLAVITDPKTGAILAMSQRPTFDPATREGLTSNWLNEAVENTIEPGSTMKAFTLAAAIEEKKWDPNAYFQSGQYKLHDATIRDHNPRGWGTITFLEGFQRSSNVSIAYLRERMGDEAFSEYLKGFGFGMKTGIDLPNEAAGVVLEKNPIERLTTMYGQGSTVTPVQMVQAATAIANDGVMMRPYVIDEIINPNTGEVVRGNKQEEIGKPISADTANQVKDILASTVTSEFGTGKKFALNGYSLAGKTGTAQIPKSSGAGYLAGHGNHLYSFLGMAPVEDPQLIAYIIVQQPKLKAGEIGSDPVSKLFKTVMEGSLKYMNIVPQGGQSVEAEALEEFVGLDATSAKEQLEKLNMKPIIIGEGGKVNAQYPENGAELAQSSVVLLDTEGVTTLPDFTGWSKKMILSFKLFSGLDIRITGTGYVSEQSLSPGTVMKANEPIVIRLRNPSERYKPEVEDEEELIIGG